MMKLEKGHRLQLLRFLFLVKSTILAALILSLSASPISGSNLNQNKQDSGNPALEQLARLKEAEFYSSQCPPGAGFTGGQKHILERILPEALQALGLAWEPDPRLASFCRWINDLLEINYKPDAVAINEAAGWLGLPEPYPHFVFMRAQLSPRLSSVIKEQLQKIRKLDQYTHYGALAEGNPGGAIDIIIAFSARKLFLSPIPRILSEPGEMEFKLSIYPGYSEPTIIHTPPDGPSEILKIEGTNLSLHPALVKLSLQAAGKHRLEVVARSKKGPEVLANFPVFVATTGRDFTGQAIDGYTLVTREQSAAKVRAKLYELINKEREKAGLSRLEIDPRLEEIAAGHSRDMAKNKFAGHISPTSGGPEQRLRAAGVEFVNFGENVGQGYLSAEAIHSGFMESPGHRMVMLDPRFTHFGIGVESEGSGPTKVFLVTELFIKKGPADALSSVSQILQKANKVRQSTGLNPVEENSELSALAQRAAEEFSQKENFNMDELQLYLINTALAAKLNFEQIQAVIITAATEEEIINRISQERAITKKAGLGSKKISAGQHAGKILAILLY